jgi:hypothetical protein
MAGCATTPDMTDFSAQTVALQTSIAEEQQQVIVQYDTIIALTERGKAENWFGEPVLPASTAEEQRAAQTLAEEYAPTKWREERQSVLGVTAQVDGLLGDIAAYSTALVNLAAKGETGRESVGQALGSLKNIANIASIGTAGIPEVAVRLAEELGELITRAQAQQTLAEAMAVVADGRGAQKVAGILNAYLSEDVADLVFALTSDRLLLERYKVGPDTVRFYSRNAPWRARQRSFALLNLDDAARQERLGSRSEAQLYADLLSCYDPDAHGCPRASAVSGLAASQLLLAMVSAEVRGYLDTKSELETWESTRIARISAIASALDAWASEHDRLAAYLEECAGVRAFRASCGTYSAANLKAAVDRIRGVLSDLEIEPARPTDGG